MQKTYDDLNRLRTVNERGRRGHDLRLRRRREQDGGQGPEGPGDRLRLRRARASSSASRRPRPASGDPRPVTSYAYDENRNRIRQTDANTHVVEMEYDSLNRLTVFTQDPGGLGFVTRHEYDENGNETMLTDPKGQTVTSTYDELNRLKTKAYAFARRRSRPALAPHHRRSPTPTTPNANLHRRSTSRWPAAPIRPRRPDHHADLRRPRPPGKPRRRPLPDGGTRTVAYTYFAERHAEDRHRPRRPSSPSYTYDGQNRLKTATTAFGRPEAATTTYTYWPDDLLKTVTYPERRRRHPRLRQGRPAHLARRTPRPAPRSAATPTPTTRTATA